ncbi:MAG: HAMP domain-containing histidine kinase [Phycisphaera sp.]|nr:MAG: HAMP domain-containing histidine kinase [Phycisphaera sp.]
MGRELDTTVEADTSGSIAAAIAHEVNNLLTPVIGLADLLEHTEGDETIKDQLIERAVERCQRAVAICGLLVDLTKDAPSSSPTCSLSDCLVAAISTAQTKAEDAGVRLECGFNEPGELALPPAVVEHILLNLLLNAIAASKSGSSVAVTAGYAPGSSWRRAAWSIWVEDRGRGLEARSVSSINRGGLPTGSPGIGLAVVRLLCQRWGGQLSVISELGIGTTFHVELPAD